MEIQTNYVDNELRNRLWNVLDYFYWRGMGKYDNDIEGDYRVFFTRLWHNYFKEPVDELYFVWRTDLHTVREYFFQCEWYAVYDFIEFAANDYPNEEINQKFKKTCNGVLESELSAYRFVGNAISKVTSEEEISEIEEALKTPLKAVTEHLKNALALMSNRKTPNYRNSVKESISAVEAICRLIANDKNATLGQALKMIKDKVGLHGALEKGFSSLYGYTSSAEGIRHALLEESTLDFEDAKFMLVSCSAFVNYLVSKASKAGVKLN